MLSIHSDKVAQIAKNHVDSVMGYMEGKGKKKLGEITSFIEAYWGSKYTFKDILAATPSILQEIVNTYPCNENNEIKCKQKEKCEKTNKGSFICAKNESVSYIAKTLYGNYFTKPAHEGKFVQGEDKKPYHAFELVNQLGVRVCPYCNRNYIFTITKNGEKKRTDQLDHFHDKSTYPLLAMSFYNLIPSCGTCNKLKEDSKEKLINPHKQIGDIKIFDVDIKDCDYASQFKLLVDDDNIFEKNIEVFHLKELYMEHKDIVKELLLKVQIYSPQFLLGIQESFGDNKLFKDEHEMITLLLGNYIQAEHLGKRPLAKLTKDIGGEIIEGLLEELDKAKQRKEKE